MEDTKKILEAIEELKSEVKSIQSTLGDEIKSVQLTLENETNRNISLIAEGHLTLERKLDESLKVNQEKELLLLRVNSLENEVRLLKERIAKIS